MKQWFFITIGLCGIFFGSNSSIVAQDSDSLLQVNTISLEVGGAGGYYSFNYARQFYAKEKTTIHARVGFSLMPVTLYDQEKPVFIVPIGAIGYYGAGHHFLKVGLTTTLYWGYEYINPTSQDYQSGCTDCPNYTNKFHFTIFPEVGYEFRFLKHYSTGLSFSPMVFDNGFMYKNWVCLNLGFHF